MDRIGSFFHEVLVTPPVRCNSTDCNMISCARDKNDTSTCNGFYEHGDRVQYYGHPLHTVNILCNAKCVWEHRVDISC